MKTIASIRSLQSPIFHATGWLLLTITIWLFGSIASAQAHRLAAAITPWPNNSSVATDRIGGHAGTVVPNPSINRGFDTPPLKDQS